MVNLAIKLELKKVRNKKEIKSKKEKIFLLFLFLCSIKIQVHFANLMKNVRISLRRQIEECKRVKRQKYWKELVQAKIILLES